MELPIEEYFKYHPPATEECQQKYDAINKAGLEFAKIIDSSITDPDYKKQALFSVQMAKMFANQGITIDQLKKWQD